MRYFFYIFIAFFLLFFNHSCKNSFDPEKIINNNDENSEIKNDSLTTNTKIENTVNENESHEVVINVNTKDFKIDKKNFKDFKVTKEQKPATKKEIDEMVSKTAAKKLDKFQKFTQDFISHCSSKDYNNAAKFIAYSGPDKSRINKDSFNPANANEMAIVKTTIDVVFGFLQESKDYEIISSKEKSTKDGSVHVIEVSFFKKGIGINRRFFDIIETNNGLIISNMK